MGGVREADSMEAYSIYLLVDFFEKMGNNGHFEIGVWEILDSGTGIE